MIGMICEIGGDWGNVLDGVMITSDGGDYANDDDKSDNHDNNRNKK